ncbi:MAG: hypothetical protein DMD64_05080 [Gemmatimonadetes bacterium]|nr:MAG: hypothetical protein DMD64_05080 [Gemmatimonadota bacterium]
MLGGLLLLPAAARAQAVPRTDTPRAGTLRFTFEPVITTWEREFIDNRHERRIGASLPAKVFVREERRVTAFAFDFGVTNRLAVSVYVPLVRVNTHATFPLDSAGQQAPDSAAQALDSLLQDTTYAFDPIVNTSRRLRYFAGDIEVLAKYRLLETHSYALSGAVLVRLPTGHEDSPNNLFDISTGDHQTDIEIQVAQELTLFDRLWLNGMVRLGRQQPGTRARRVGPQSTLLLPHAALATLAWDPGDYAAVDVAPMLRLAKHFGVGVTAGYWTKQRDHYRYRSAQDSIDVATRLGAAVNASVLDAGTGVRRTRLGVALTYLGSDVEGSLSFEQTVSAAGGLVPVATVFRIVMRTSRWPF